MADRALSRRIFLRGAKFGNTDWAEGFECGLDFVYMVLRELGEGCDSVGKIEEDKIEDEFTDLMERFKYLPQNQQETERTEKEKISRKERV